MTDILRMLPQRYYTIGGRQYLMSNLTSNVNISEMTKRSAGFFIDYRVRPNETARQIADRLYEDDDFYWTIYFVNNIINVDEDWPRRNLADWMSQRHTEAELAEVIRYADVDRNTVDLRGLRFQHGFTEATHPDATMISVFNLTPITLRELYIMEDDKKRNIKLIDPDFIEDFSDAVQEALR